MSKKLKPRDKITQKMSRDGLIEVNETAGTAELVSGREQDADFSKKPEQAAQEAAQQLPHPSGSAAARPHTPELSPKRDDAAAERVLEHIDAAHTRAASKKAIKRAQQEAAAKQRPHACNSPRKNGRRQSFKRRSANRKEPPTAWRKRGRLFRRRKP